MALKDTGAAVTDQTVITQIAGALMTAASQIFNEGARVPDHANRLAYARYVFQAPLQAAAFMPPGIFSNPTIAGEAGGTVGASGTPFPDNDVQFVVNSIINIYADQFVAQINVGSTLQFGQ
jgi:hypothetical protein